MKLTLTSLFTYLAIGLAAGLSFNVCAANNSEDINMLSSLDSITNYQVNSLTMVSAGQPSVDEFKALKSAGVTHVIDLLPGDRSQDKAFIDELELNYFNVKVEWQEPSLENFQDYVSYMNSSHSSGGIILTHCKLNWRGAVFTYLYQVTQLGMQETLARQQMESIWEPNRRWQVFIKTVKTHYANK